MTGTHGDIDLLVCFKGGDDNYRLIFLEAKGYSSWNSRQMTSKVARLKLLFGDDGISVHRVRPVYCLASPKPPRRLNFSDWPDWLLNTDESPHFLELPLPTDRLQVTRWDAEKCEASQNGGDFRIQKSGDAKGKTQPQVGCRSWPMSNTGCCSVNTANQKPIYVGAPVLPETLERHS